MEEGSRLKLFPWCLLALLGSLRRGGGGGCRQKGVELRKPCRAVIWSKRSEVWLPGFQSHVYYLVAV